MTDDDREIELVMAYVRPDKIGDVKEALADVGAPSLTVTNVSGRGSQPARTGQWRGEEYVVDAIQRGAHTGEPGDGKVFVLPVERAVQIRTGKSGPDAV